MTGRINHITADQPPRLACPEARFAYQTDSDFFLIVDCARGFPQCAETSEPPTPAEKKVGFQAAKLVMVLFVPVCFNWSEMCCLAEPY